MVMIDVKAPVLDRTLVTAGIHLTSSSLLFAILITLCFARTSFRSHNMARPPRLLFILAVLLASLGLSLAACMPLTAYNSKEQRINTSPASTSFCKCTCFSNSTIIQLDGTNPSSTPNPSNGGSKSDAAKKTRGTCSDCNKAFCLSYNLPICKRAKEEDVFTTCFQRDSAKDEAVVFIFIGATTGLLVYAAVRPWVERWTEVCYDDPKEGVDGERTRRITLS